MIPLLSSVQLEVSAKKPQLHVSQPHTPAPQPAEMALTQRLPELEAPWKVNKPLRQDVPPVM